MYDMGYYADLYVKRKKELIPLMEQYYGQPLPVNATHQELIAIYIGLLKNPEFVARLDSGFNNAVDPVTAAIDALGSAFGMFGGSVRTAKANQETARIQAKSQSDAAMAAIILAKQGKDNTGKILLFAGVAVVVVGAIITVIILKRRK
jgi:hypothetical protein